MNITVNGKPYSQSEVHSLFEQARSTVAHSNVSDEYGYISKTLAATELCTHLIGSIPELWSYLNFH